MAPARRWLRRLAAIFNALRPGLRRRTLSLPLVARGMLARGPPLATIAGLGSLAATGARPVLVSGMGVLCGLGRVMRGAADVGLLARAGR